MRTSHRGMVPQSAVVIRYRRAVARAKMHICESLQTERDPVILADMTNTLDALEALLNDLRAGRLMA